MNQHTPIVEGSGCVLCDVALWAYERGGKLWHFPRDCEIPCTNQRLSTVRCVDRNMKAMG